MRGWGMPGRSTRGAPLEPGQCAPSAGPPTVEPGPTSSRGAPLEAGPCASSAGPPTLEPGPTRSRGAPLEAGPCVPSLAGATPPPTHAPVKPAKEHAVAHACFV